MTLFTLKPVMAALKVLADALMRTGIAHDVVRAGRILADVEETEVILAGHWEGVLQETRRELEDQRRAAAAATAVVAPVAAAE